MGLARLQSSVRHPANLSQHVYEAVTAGIAGGDLPPGTRVVVEHLAQQLGVSQTPVREALGRLITEGLIVECGSGRFQVVPLTRAYVADTYLVRGALEGLAAELAAPRFSDAQLADIAVALDEVDAALRLGSSDAYARFDDLLHRSIFQMAGSAVLLRELLPLQIHVDLIRQYSRHLGGEHIALSHVEHGAIVGALRARDARRSRRAMEAHIRKAGRRIERLIDFRARGGEFAEEGATHDRSPAR